MSALLFQMLSGQPLILGKKIPAELRILEEARRVCYLKHYKGQVESQAPMQEFEPTG
jgi:hypothetical protein